VAASLQIKRAAGGHRTVTLVHLDGSVLAGIEQARVLLRASRAAAGATAGLTVYNAERLEDWRRAGHGRLLARPLHCCGRGNSSAYSVDALGFVRGLEKIRR
jgi:hypothetical protein